MNRRRFFAALLAPFAAARLRILGRSPEAASALPSGAGFSRQVPDGMFAETLAKVHREMHRQAVLNTPRPRTSWPQPPPCRILEYRGGRLQKRE